MYDSSHVTIIVISYSKTSCFGLQRSISFRLKQHLYDTKTTCFAIEDGNKHRKSRPEKDGFILRSFV